MTVSPSSSNPFAAATAGNPFVDFVRGFANDRVGFVRHVLQVVPYPWQERDLAALDRGEKRLSIRSGHGVGKSTFVAWIIIHYLATTIQTKVAVTAPSKDQLQDAVIAEVRAWLARMPDPWPNLFEITSERIFLKSAPTECFCTFRTSRAERPEALQGVHAVHTLLVVDESSGVPNEVWEAAIGSLSTPGAIAVLTGNPTRASGFFYDTFDNERWHRDRVSSLDVPNIDRDFIDDIKRTYGEDSNVYRVRVLGEPPRAEDDTLIPLHLVEESFDRDISAGGAHETWGLDVARFGDDRSVLCRRKGMVLQTMEVWRNKDSTELADLVASRYKDLPVQKRPVSINVDVIGVGAGVYDRLVHLGCPAYAVNVAETPASSRTGGLRLRDELWLKTKAWFEERTISMKPLALEMRRALANELSTVKFTFNEMGKIKVESKQDMKKRGLRSADLAEAVILTTARESTIVTGSGLAFTQGSINKNLAVGWANV